MLALTQFSLALAALSSVVASPLSRRDDGVETPLAVTIIPIGNAVFSAKVTNTGSTDLNLFAYGTLLDSSPVEKLNIYNVPDASAESSDYTHASRIPFTGILRTILRTNLSAEAFIPLTAGATYETTIDAASVHDFDSETYAFVAEGAIPYGPIGTTDFPTLAHPYRSNLVTIPVDGPAARKSKRDLGLEARANVQADCTGTNLVAMNTALSNCVKLATFASIGAAAGNDARFKEYFKTTDVTVRATVSARFKAVAKECSSANSGTVSYYCIDPQTYCKPNVVAYTLAASGTVVNCPAYYTALPPLTDVCHNQDQVTTTIHEFTHVPAVYSPSTKDNGYGYAAATALTSELAVLNADTYALFANAVLLNC
ncbi:hypothetical protein VE00_05740 [Pseudogymnoascus sp. WSF 3629]|nr:hypothetical protein VE00_05740 [Pseudogymnoascus sp. WSF 3629]